MSGPRAASAPELKAQIEAERAGRPFLVFRDGADEQRDRRDRGRAPASSGSAAASPPTCGWTGTRRSPALHAQIEVVARRVHPGRRRPLPQRLLRQRGARPRPPPPARRRHAALRPHHGRCTAARARAPAAEETAIATETPAAATISPAQRRVLVALCRPYKDGGSFATPATNQQIGAELHLSVDAVKTHMRALFEKLGVGDLPQNQKRVALVERALQTGVVSSREL